MNGQELNKLRLKAEIMLDKANELIRFCNMIEITQSCIKKHGDLVGSRNIIKWNHEVNRRKVLVNSLKNDLQCIN
tara:strand:+ start:639 stop:863 length:225 start_codon:yes stop_codon:yes gene_type:complete